MNLIDRYIDEVGKHLPYKSRADIQAEIRSTLEDMFEDRAKETGQPQDDKLLKEVLREFGAPEKIAASYTPERYLIGPRLYPTFILVLKIVITVLTVVAATGFGVKVGTTVLTPESFSAFFGKSILEYLGGIISAFGNIVFIFAILQWALPASKFDDKDEEETWDPASLEEGIESDDVNPWSPIWEIVMSIAGLLIFNLYPKIIGIGYFDGGTWTFVPVLSDAFFQYLPWIDVLWVMGIGLNIVLLRQRRWNTILRWCELAMTLLSTIMAYIMLKGPSLVNTDVQVLTAIFKDTEAAGVLTTMFSNLPYFILGILVLVQSIEMIKKLYDLVIKPKNQFPISIH